MDTVQHIKKEFEHRVFEESYARIESCLGMLSLDQIWSAPNATTVSVGCLVKHLMGNMQQWVFAGVLKKPYKRNRDFEFVPEPELSKQDLLNQMDAARSLILQAFDDLSGSHLTSNYNIQGFETTGFSAIIHVIEHFSYHVGQITTLTKLHTNRETNYYGESDLNVDA